MPNVFTPNSDQFNDVFSPFNVEGIDSLNVIIYNRWGECVFRSSGDVWAWDGTSNGKELPASTYFWIMDYHDRFGDAHHLSGTVELIR